MLELERERAREEAHATPASGHSTNAIVSSKYGSRSPHSAALKPDEAVEVEVRHRRRPVVEVADRERRARHRLLDPERPAGAAHERRLARAELAPEQDDVTGPKQAGERAAERLGLGRRLA